MSEFVEGGCQCGAVRYRIRQPLTAAYACHCRECQKQTGSAFALSMPVRKTALQITGALSSFDRTADSGAITSCYFCTACGSRLYHTNSASADWLTLKAGTLDDASGIRPVAHLWISRKQDWVVLDPAVPAFETQPQDLATWRTLLSSAKKS